MRGLRGGAMRGKGRDLERRGCHHPLLSAQQIAGTLCSARQIASTHPQLSACLTVGSSPQRAPDSEHALLSARQTASPCGCLLLLHRIGSSRREAIPAFSLLRLITVSPSAHLTAPPSAHLTAITSTPRCTTHQRISLRHASEHLAAPRISTPRCTTHQHISLRHASAHLAAPQQGSHPACDRREHLTATHS